MVDLIIKGGHLVNGDRCDIAVKDGKIVEVFSEINGEAKRIVDVPKDAFVSFGWIDSHVHCFETMNLYYDYPDEIGYKSGVATLIDAGSSGASNIHDFYAFAKQAKTHVYALMNISKDGIFAQNELEDLSLIDNDVNEARIREMSDFIVGIKARMSKSVVGSNNVEPLKLAKALQSRFNSLPLMVHIGSAPPELNDILNILEAGDVITHCYNGKENGILDREGAIKPFVWEAYKKGILFDVGHGTDSFNFNVAKTALEEGLRCHTISSDIYIRNRLNGPVFSLPTTMEKLLDLGVSLEEAVPMVTEVPASIYNLNSKGKLETGYDADITIFTYNKGDVVLTDSNGNQMTSHHILKPLITVVSGDVYDIREV